MFVDGLGALPFPVPQISRWFDVGRVDHDRTLGSLPGGEGGVGGGSRWEWWCLWRVIGHDRVTVAGGCTFGCARCGLLVGFVSVIVEGGHWPLPLSRHVSIQNKM